MHSLIFCALLALTSQGQRSEPMNFDDDGGVSIVNKREDPPPTTPDEPPEEDSDEINIEPENEINDTVKTEEIREEQIENRIEYVTLDHWQNEDPSCNLTQTYGYALLACPTKHEVLTTDSENKSVIVIDKGKDAVEQWSFPQHPYSTNAYTVVHDSEFAFKIYEIKML